MDNGFGGFEFVIAGLVLVFLVVGGIVPPEFNWVYPVIIWGAIIWWLTFTS